LFTVYEPNVKMHFAIPAGILQFLQETYDLAQCSMVGSSAGALLSVLAACSVQPQAALDRAYELCLEHGVFKRPLGLLVRDVRQHDKACLASSSSSRNDCPIQYIVNKS
jgi:hypothetical protein